MYREIPRIFHQNIKEILAKCHHRKRLVEYFKIAKTLGIKVDSVNFSSFLLSVTQAGEVKKEPFKRVLTGVSLSGEVEKELLEEIGG